MGEGGEGLFAFGGVDGGVDAEMAGEDTIDVAIDDGSREAEGDAPNGGSGIVAYAGHGCSSPGPATRAAPRLP